MKRVRNSVADTLARMPVWLAVMGTASLPAFAQAEDEATVVLDTIVVTASGQAQALPDAPETMTVITGEELEKRPYAAITDALKNVPGVVISPAGGKTGLPSISIRGMAHPAHRRA